METKQCTKCKEIKEVILFRKQSGRKSKYTTICTECKKLTEKLWREKNRLQRRAKQRLHYAKNKEIFSKKRKLNYNPIKAQARYLARSIKLKPCIICGEKAERHHPNYNEPFNVVFLCKSHHKQVHDKTLTL